MKEQTVNAIIVTYNRKTLLKECLDAILDQSYPVSEITIIDNASTDGTLKMLKSNKYIDNKIIKYIPLSKNIGGAGGFYTGLKRFKNKKYKWAWIMDDDVVPKKDALEKLITASNKISKNVSFFASSVYSPNHEPMNVPDIDNTNEENGYQFWYEFLDKGMIRIKSATFVSLLINHDAVNKVGLPCKDYFIWGDDSEYTRRLTKYYGKAYLVGSSEVVHKRKNSKSLNIFSINEKNRLNLIWRMYRNNFINIKYYEGNKGAIKKVIQDIIVIKKSIGRRNGLIRIKQILKGDILGQLQYKKVKKYINNQLGKVE